MNGKVTIGKVKSSFVIKFWFSSSSVVKVKVTVRNRPLSVIIILYFNLTWRDEMQIITKSSFVQWQNTIYITEAGSKDMGYYFLLSLSLRSLWKTSAWHPCGINQLAMEHNVFQLKCQSLLKHSSTRLDKHVVNKKNYLVLFFFCFFYRFFNIWNSFCQGKSSLYQWHNTGTFVHCSSLRCNAVSILDFSYACGIVACKVNVEK